MKRGARTRQDLSLSRESGAKMSASRLTPCLLSPPSPISLWLYLPPPPPSSRFRPRSKEPGPPTALRRDRAFFEDARPGNHGPRDGPEETGTQGTHAGGARQGALSTSLAAAPSAHGCCGVASLPLPPAFYLYPSTDLFPPISNSPRPRPIPQKLVRFCRMGSTQTRCVYAPVQADGSELRVLHDVFPRSDQIRLD